MEAFFSLTEGSFPGLKPRIYHRGYYSVNGNMEVGGEGIAEINKI